MSDKTATFSGYIDFLSDSDDPEASKEQQACTGVFCATSKFFSGKKGI